jgi:uncharacterized membrane protein
MKVGFPARLLSASAYLFGIPALYIVLTVKEKGDFVRRHGSQAFLLWIAFFVIFFMIRLLIDWLWSWAYMPGLAWFEITAVFLMGCYAVFCAWRSFLGREFQIPG